MFHAVRKPLSPIVVVAVVASLLTGIAFSTASHFSRALASAATGTGGVFVATQGRVLDTRPAYAIGGYSTPMSAGSWRSVAVLGAAGVPASGVGAVQVTVTAIPSGSSTGSISLEADSSSAKPLVALTYGYEPGAYSNTAIVPIADTANIKAEASASTDLLIDIQGYYTDGDAAAGGYVPVTPTRVASSAAGTAWPKAQIASGTTKSLQLGGVAGVPADASAVFVNVTVQDYTSSNGYLTPYAADQSRPNASLDYPNNATTAFGTTVPLSTGTNAGALKIYVNNGPVDVWVDVVGYFAGSPGGTGSFTPATATVAKSVAMASGTTKAIAVTGLSGVPQAGSGISAVAMGMQATTSGTDGGYLTVWASTDTKPSSTSSMNLPHVASTTSNFVTSKIGTDGKINVYNSGPDAITLTITVQGWYTNSGGAIANGQTQTAQTVLLQADASGGGAWVTYQYRNGTTGSFTPVPTANTADGDGHQPNYNKSAPLQNNWPVQSSSGQFTAFKWNIRDTLAALPGNSGVAPDSLLQVQACYGSSSTDTNLACGMVTNVEFSQANSSGSSAELGPGSVDELTGDYQLSAADADAADSLGSLSIGRTLTTLHPANNTGMAGIFGAGWTADLDDLDAGSPSLTPVDHTALGYILLADTDGSETTYTADATITGQYDGAGDDSGDTSIVTTGTSKGNSSDVCAGMASGLSLITLTEADGTTTVWSNSSPGWQVACVRQPGTSSTTTYTWNSAGQVSRILAPVPFGVSCSNPDTTPGCRSLTLTYTTVSVGGTNVSRLGEVDLSIPQISGTANSKPVANYDYDSSGRLAHAWDPRISPALKTAYTYTSGNRLATLTPPGLATWSFGYDANNRLITASRPDPSGQTATTTVVYDISNSTSGPNAGPVDLSTTNTAHWGETDDLPATGTAVFQPDHNPAGTTVTAVTTNDWPYASIDYLDVNGNTVNSAAYGASAWQVDTTQYDATGNQTWSLTAGNRAQALSPTDDTDSYVKSLDNVHAAALLRSDTVYDPLSGSVTDTYGPAHPVTLTGGSPIDARTHVATSYDEGAPTTAVDPNTGAPVNPATGQPYDLPTTVTTTAYDVAAKTDTAWPDIQVTHTGYDPVVSGDASGWTQGQASTSTTQMAQTSSSSDLVTRTRYDANGRVIEQRLPNDASGSTPRTVLTSYYTASSSAGCTDPTRAGLVCSTAPAAQPATGSPLAVVSYAYNQYGDQTSKTETFGTGPSQVVRTTATSYDAGERNTSSSISVIPTSAGGTALPTVSYSYDSGTGLPTTTSTGTGPSIVSLSTGYNNIGEATSYADATGNVSHTGFDLDGRPISLNDGKGTTGYTYDGSGSGEHRGVATGEDIGVSGAPSAFAATYDAAGNLSAETYPNGLVASRHYDNAGDLTSLTYAKSGSTWMSFSQNTNALGQVANQTSPQSSQTFIYDPADRLTSVADTYSGACTTRVFAFDTDSNRTSLKSYPGTGTGGATCSSSTTPTTTSYSYDAADRLTSDTAGSYTYDSLGRTNLIPASDAKGIGAHSTITGNATIGYNTNDMVATEQQGATTDTFTLDPDQNRVNTQIEGTTTSTDHYSDDSDSPTWTATGSAAWTRNLNGIDGGLAAVDDQTGVATLQLTNPHGDIIAQCPDLANATSVSSYGEFTEYGQSRAPGTAYSTYGYLGSKQRSVNDLAGMTLMGVRLYNSNAGRFGSTDPVSGGNANAYIYPGDPINSSDPSGKTLVGGGDGAEGAAGENADEIAAAESGANGPNNDGIYSPSQLAHIIHKQWGGTIKKNKGGWTVTIPYKRGRPIILRCMDHGGGRTNYWRMGIEGKGSFTATGAVTNNRAETHISITAYAYEQIYDILDRLECPRDNEYRGKP